MSDAEMALIEEGATFKFAVVVAAAMDRNLRPSTLQFLGAFIRNQGLRPPAVLQAPVGRKNSIRRYNFTTLCPRSGPRRQAIFPFD